ncbi:MAG: tetratricopeptide repeat protein [Anaerolineales bacterium]
MSKEEMLQEAVEAGQSGELARARQLLLELLRLDNREPLYWLLMSTAVESRDERIYCLQNVLFLDPENSAAKHDLELLGAEIPQPDAPALIPEEQENWQTAEIAAPKLPKKNRKFKEEPWSISWIFATLGIGLVIILLGYYGAQIGFLDVLLPNATATGGPATAQQTGSEATSTSNQVAAPTRDIVVVPRDPNDLLAATYTATPRYVNTPHAESATFQRGLDALNAGNWDLATAAFQEYLASNPQAADAAYYLGEALLGSGDLEAAQTAFDQALALDAQFAPAYLGRGRVGIAQLADSATILTDLNTSVLLDPSLVDAYLERAAYNLARENSDAALEDLIAAEERAPLSALVQYHRALVHLAREEYPAALAAAQRAHDLDLTLLANYLSLAEAQQQVQQYDASIEILQTYLTFEGGDGRGWELLGIGYQLSGQSVQALEAFHQALSIDPNLPIAAYYRGLQEQAGGSHQSALSYFRIAVTGEPDWFEARIALAQEYLATGNPSSAFLEINLSSNLLKTDSQRAAFFYWRALTLEALGQAENALADWRSLLNLPAAAVPPDWRATAEQRVQGS